MQNVRIVLSRDNIISSKISNFFSLLSTNFIYSSLLLISFLKRRDRKKFFFFRIYNLCQTESNSKTCITFWWVFSYSYMVSNIPIFTDILQIVECFQEFIRNDNTYILIIIMSNHPPTLSHHSSQSFITSGRSSRQHPVSSQSCCMYVRAGRPAFARLYEGIHRSTSVMSSSLLLQQCPAYLVRLTFIVFVMGGRWPYSWCFVWCCLQDLFKIARSFVSSNYFISITEISLFTVTWFQASNLSKQS